MSTKSCLFHSHIATSSSQFEESLCRSGTICFVTLCLFRSYISSTHCAQGLFQDDVLICRSCLLSNGAPLPVVYPTVTKGFLLSQLIFPQHIFCWACKSSSLDHSRQNKTGGGSLYEAGGFDSAIIHPTD